MKEFDDTIFDFMIGWIIGMIITYFTMTAILLTMTSFQLIEVFAYSVVPAVFVAPLFGLLYTMVIK